MDSIPAGAAVWRDDPITSSADDTLGRGHVARRAAGLVVETHSWESSVVIGLIGPWGSGKSSVLELTIERAQEGSPRMEGRQIHAVGRRRYEWAPRGVLRSDRIRTSREAVREVQVWAGRRRGSLFTRSSACPARGDRRGGGAQWFSKWLRRQKPWAESFREASATLRDLNTPVLVVADDIDRLQGDELLGFLKVVRLVGRFAGISYLLGLRPGKPAIEPLRRRPTA